MFKRLICTVLIVASLLSIGGCGIPATPIELIKAPVFEEDYQTDKFTTTLRTLLPEGSRLLTSSQKGNGIFYGDLDGDGIDEAVVVYEENVFKERVLRAALLQQYNEEWRIIWDTKGSGYGLDYAAIKDVTKDGSPDIILGWSLGAGENGLDIYEWRNKTLKLLLKTGYRGSLDLNNVLQETINR